MIVKAPLDTLLPVEDFKTKIPLGRHTSHAVASSSQTYNNKFVPDVVVLDIFDECHHFIEWYFNYSTTHEAIVKLIQSYNLLISST